MVWSAITRVGSRVADDALAAGIAGFGLAEAGDLLGFGIFDGGGGGGSDGPLGGLLGGRMIIWAFLGVAMLAVIADLGGE